jgi:hypothetical protein
MFINKNVLSGIQIFVAASLLAINIGLLIWFLFFGYESGFHSDSAAKVLLAREIIITKDYFPDDWNYINNDLFVFFGHTFIIPLLEIMPAGFTAHAISGLIFFCSSAYWCLARFRANSLKCAASSSDSGSRSGGCFWSLGRKSIWAS